MTQPRSQMFRTLGFALFLPILLVFAVACGQSTTENNSAPLKVTIDRSIQPYEHPATSTGTTLAGTITFDGQAPPRREIKMQADPTCHHDEPVLTEALIVNDGKLANVLVYIKDPGGEYEPLNYAKKLDQVGCVYIPHALAVMTHQPIEIVNSDQTLHNVNCLAKTNPRFNVGQPKPGSLGRAFAKPEIGIKFKCDVHPWMNAYVHVFDHPFFAITDEDGSFAIKGIPAGTHTLVAWHEKLGEIEQEITATSDSDPFMIDLVFEGPKKRPE